MNIQNKNLMQVNNMESSAINLVRGAMHYSPGNIIRVQAHSNYCKIHFINDLGSVVVSKVLHLVQANLPADMFVRVHRSHLINRSFIKNVFGTHSKKVELSNGEYIPVSRRKQGAFDLAKIFC